MHCLEVKVVELIRHGVASRSRRENSDHNAGAQMSENSLVVVAVASAASSWDLRFNAGVA